MKKDEIEALEKQITLLKKKLQRSEESRNLIEQAKDHYDLVYRSSIKKLDAQKNLLDRQNQELDVVRRELLIKNQELSDSRKAADQANEAKSRFLANMSHEIRTPLNGILGFLELLELTPLDEEQKRYLREVNGASEMLLFLINDILDFSKIEAGQMSLEAIRFNLQETIHNAVALAKPNAEKKGVRIELQMDANLPCEVTGDPIRLLQVLNNLLSNGVKFTAQGYVALNVVLAEDDGERQNIEFRVEDTGIGVKAAEIPRLFTAFAQADTSITRKYGGTGLGLVISQELVRLMGGVIHVTSGSEGGALFSFCIPFKREKAAPKICPSKPWERSFIQNIPEGCDIRVLLAEDNPTNVHLMELMLKRIGLVCDAVNNGILAVEACRLRDYDLILMDCQMPEMDGYQAAQCIRTQKTHSAGAVIIALTANAMVGERNRCIAAGMDDYLAKPISGNVFYPLLQNYVDQISARLAEKRMEMAGELEFENIEHVTARLAADLQCDSDMLRELVVDFIDRLGPLSDCLLDTIQRQEAEAVRLQLHQIAGVSGNMRFMSIYEQVNRIAETVKDGNWENAARLAKELRRCAAKLRQECEGNRGFQA